METIVVKLTDGIKGMLFLSNVKRNKTHNYGVKYNTLNCMLRGEIMVEASDLALWERDRVRNIK